VVTAPLKTALWGQLDLAGDVYEWNLDWYDNPYVNPCTDCAYLTPTSGRMFLGGSFIFAAAGLLPTVPGGDTPVGRNSTTGFRCARTP
jgi:formylglycine-generating enzyme required for sulfatase activity